MNDFYHKSTAKIKPDHRSPGILGESRIEQSIFKVIESNDLKGAETAVERHLDQVEKDILERLVRLRKNSMFD